MTYLLDTSVYSQLLKRTPHPGVLKRWKPLPDHEIAIAAPVEMELLYGIALSPSPNLPLLYEKMLKGRFPILAFDAAAARQYAEWQAAAVRQGQTRPVVDLMIAATARVHALTLATLNLTHFAGLEGLRVEDWSI